MTYTTYAKDQTMLPIDDGKNILKAAIKLLRSTALVHLDRDFPDDPDNPLDPDGLNALLETMTTKINDDNYMRLMTRNDGRVVILFHKSNSIGDSLRDWVDEADAKGEPLWTVSVGFDANLLSEPAGTGGALKCDYKTLAREVSNQLIAHTTQIRTLREKPWRYVLSVDHGDGPGTVEDEIEGEPENRRRVKKVGEFGWVAEKDTQIKGDWEFKRVRIRNDKGWGKTAIIDVTRARLN